ncbi:AraC family transcriptional regulator [Nocardia macrotermitis]|uniref:HTH-type transcriptional regulator NimR n=1 Tax=Nocardia macrotermitis TaxID=2585198 RepID=A0A7K0CU22_9NOCA|nr:helix-turn-helix transcriptional regulator [Nocardia macrotermitis]MQY16975.1 HTH-type transcriptional regulator NimR [Nocardia macrotermitis]
MIAIRHTPVAPTTSYAREGGDVIDRHRHDDHQLIYVSSGVLAIHTEHGSWITPNDRALWIPANTWHEHRFYGRSRFHAVGFPARGSAPLLDVRTPTIIAVDALVREVLIALTSPTLTTTETRHLRAVLRDRLHRVAEQPFTLPVPRDIRLANACRLVEADLSVPRTLADVARDVHTGERTLSRLFRTEFAMTYPQWRTRTRVFAAMVMLAEGAAVTDTAHACGWATTSAFVHTFAQTMGTTPGAYRAGMRAERD